MDASLANIDPSKVLQLVERLDFPRVVGSDGENRAFEIIREEMERFGVPVAFEEFTSPWMDFTQAFVEIGSKQLPIEPLISPVYNHKWLPIPKTVEIEGRLIDGPIPEHETEAYIALRKQCEIDRPCMPGTSAQVFVCPPEDSFIAYYLACHKLIPSAYLNIEYAASLLQSIGSVCRFYWDSREVDKTLRNMTAEIKGTKIPNEIILVGAHIDSWPGTVGASDNASGTAMLVEFANWFVAHPPVRTVRFVWFTGEELDRRGSRAYVTMHSQDKDTVCLYVNLDSGVSIEHSKPRVAVTGSSRLIGALQQLMVEIGKDIPVFESEFGSTDTVAFHNQGIATVHVCARYRTPYPHPHLPTDRFDKLDIKKLRLIGGLSLSIIDAAQKGELPLETQRDRR